MLFTLLGCSLLPVGALAFGMESILPVAHDLHAHLPVAIHQASFSAFSTAATTASTTTLPTGMIIDFSSSAATATAQTQSISSAISVGSNNLLASQSVAAPGVGDIASSLLSEYRKALDAEPLKVKIITGCLLAILGDALAQSRQLDEEYNKKRAGAFVAFDGVWRTVQQVTYGPIIQTCNGKFTAGLVGSLPLLNVQDQLLRDENKVILGAIEQTLVSQLVLIPLLYYPIFYAVTGVVQNLTVEETITRAKETFIPLMKRNLLFWIPVQFGAFYFVEENLQIPVLTAFGLIWNVILSLSAGKVSKSSDDEKEGVMDGSSIEDKMVLEARATEGSVGSSRGKFFFGSSKATAGSDADSAATASKTNTKTSKVLK